MNPPRIRLYIPTMDAVLVDYAEDGSILREGEDWSRPTLQERRAILHAAQLQLQQLQDLIATLEK